MVLAAFSGFALADSITGVVTNKTTNKPAAGDDVVLIRLAQGMQEAARTKTDAKGRFTLDVAASDTGMHLVRVTHDKANYFRPAPPGTQSVEVEVFNAAAKVKGVSSEADVMRMQTDESGKSLHVVENFFVKNESNPPLTQFSDRPFEFYLPEGAVVEGRLRWRRVGCRCRLRRYRWVSRITLRLSFRFGRERRDFRLLTSCLIAGA